MKETMTLLKIQLAARYGFAEMKTNKKQMHKRLGMLAVVAFAMIYLLAIYVFIMFMVFQGAKQLGSPEIVITISSAACAFVVFLFGIFIILTVLFFAKDSEFLLSLPVRQRSIFASKFAMVMLREYPLMLFLMLPPVIIYGVYMGLSVLYYLKALIIILLLPLIPLAASALLSMLLMRIAARMRHRELFATVGGILFFALIMVGQLLLNNALSSSDPSKIMQQFAQKGGAVDMLGRYYPPALWATKSLMSSDIQSWLNLLLFVVVSVAAFVVVLMLASFIYQKGSQAQFETAKTTKSNVKMSYRSGAPVFAIFKNEWITILKTPIYAMNILFGIILAPIILIMPLAAGAQSRGSSHGFAELAALGTKAGDTIMMLVLAGIIMLFSPMNPAPSTALSREGKCLWLMKTMPLTPRTQILGKFYCGYSISALIAVCIAIVFAFAYHASPVAVFCALILSLIFLVITTALSLIIDVLRPKLSWANEQEAIKQNMNVLAAMLLSFLLAGILAVPGIFFAIFKLPLLAIFGIYLVLFGGLAFGAMAALFNLFESRFNKLSI